ncbi:LOW QUALITY PROTEIN: putative two-component system sensor kinase [Geomicrobium sp. JCM 19039]|nr:LOW QUALITY PROTEIN: putative two-component system sensor kinase [Geomicrobium sp. JCM 19039]
MVNVWRFMNIFFLIALWIGQGVDLSGFLFVLIFAVLISLRWRIELPDWTIMIDLLLCVVFIPFWDSSAYGLLLPAFEMMRRKKISICIIVMFILVVYQLDSLFLLWFLFQAGLFGVWTGEADVQRAESLKEADQERKARYELEAVKEELLKASRDAAHLAEVTERNRIARDLHDHVGHDLTGANLALQAYEQLEGQQAKDMLNEVRQRVERSTVMLRDTVHDMTPVTRIGADRLEQITAEYPRIPVSFQKTGNTEQVPIHFWSLLEPCLKEALTNVSRHSDATRVNVQLDVTERFVRLSIQDDGRGTEPAAEGSGIRNLKLRARSFGGSVSVNVTDGYLIVCILPLEEDKL